MDNVTKPDIMAHLRETLIQGAKDDREREREEAEMLAKVETAMQMRERYFGARVWPTFTPWEKEEWGATSERRRTHLRDKATWRGVPRLPSGTKTHRAND